MCSSVLSCDSLEVKILAVYPRKGAWEEASEALVLVRVRPTPAIREHWVLCWIG